MTKQNTIAWTVVLIVTASAIITLNYLECLYGLHGKTEVTVKNLLWPPSTLWLFCFFIGYIAGEAIRRILANRANRMAPKDTSQS